MKCCQNLYFLSTLACQLSECLDEQELEVLAADLVVLSDMLANILARSSGSSECEEPDHSNDCADKQKMPKT